MRERTRITKTLLENLPNLKYIMTSGMRNNSINLEVTKKKGIIVCGTEINSNPAAEVTWTLILGLLRNVKQEIDNMFQGYWQTTIGSELKGKMLGVIGLGKIGTQVAKVGKAFGMEVCAWSENLNLSHANELGVLPMSKEDLLKNSDIISLHLVLGERYKNLITKKEIEMMKKTSFLINTSRGPIINENDSTATDEIKFGDNDLLAAKIAKLFKANLLIMLSTVEGLYKEKDEIDSNQSLIINKISKIDSKIRKMANDKDISGKGCMKSKLLAAEACMQNKCDVVIGSGLHPNPIKRIFKENTATWFRK